METIGYLTTGFIGLVLCLWLISQIAYAAAQKHTAMLFERDPVDLPFQAVAADMDARASAAAA
jgi:hypothetical protein